jgi:hypothetical protein
MVWRMTFGWRKAFTLGPLRLNLSKRGISTGLKVGPFSTNSRTRRLRIALPFNTWWQSKWRIGDEDE